MKITAEFNSTAELVSFISAFGANNSIPMQGVAIADITSTAAEIKKTVKVEDAKKPSKPEDESVAEVLKEEIIPVKEAEITPPKEETKTDAPKEEVKVTKEMVRERLGAIMKAGKQTEVKDLVAKHGANKLPDLKEDEYAAVYEEAEKLL